LNPTTDDLSAIDKLYHSGAWLCLGLVAVFLVLRYAATRWAWLKEDHRAVWVSAILGGLALLVVPATQGTTPNLSTILTAVFTVLALHADPKKTPAEQDKAAQGGFIRLSLMLVIAAIAGAVLLAGCGASTRHKVLAGTFASLDVASAELVKIDGEQETALATKATSEAAGTAALGVWWSKVDTVEKALAEGYRAVAAAALADDDRSLAGALQAATIVKQALTAIGVKL